MPNIINSSYFIREVSLADRGNPTVVNEINSFIQKYEPIYLSQLLGESLAIEFITGLADVSPLQKWIDLRNRLADSTVLISPIANYCYYFIQDNKTTTTAGTSETKAKNENSLPASAWDKQVFAWNEMVKMSKNVWKWVDSNEDAYPGLEYDTECKEIFSFINSFNF